MKTSSSINKIVFFIFVFVIWALLAFNTCTVDRTNYEMFYFYAQHNIRFPGIEIGFYYFMYICAKIGLDFQGFLIIYSSFGTIIFINSIKNYINNGRNIVLLLFIFFPYLHIIAALRNYMAFVILVSAIQYLKCKSKGSMVKYIICILFASSFHTIALFYLIFILCYQNNNRIIFFSIFFSSFVFIILVSSESLISLLIEFNPKLYSYLYKGFAGTRWGTKTFLCIYFIVKLIFCLYCKTNRRYDSSIIVMRKIHILSFVFLPICLFDMDFMRLEYNIFILMSMYMYLYIKKQINEYGLKKKHILLTVLFILYYIISGYILLYLFSYESIVKTIWENNLLL